MKQQRTAQPFHNRATQRNNLSWCYMKSPKTRNVWNAWRTPDWFTCERVVLAETQTDKYRFEKQGSTIVTMVVVKSVFWPLLQAFLLLKMIKSTSSSSTSLKWEEETATRRKPQRLLDTSVRGEAKEAVNAFSATLAGEYSFHCTLLKSSLAVFCEYANHYGVVSTLKKRY